MVVYWHWHSIHNGIKTYWKDLLSHDFETNPTYTEAKTIGKEFERLSSHLGYPGIVKYSYNNGKELLSNKIVSIIAELQLEPSDVKIVEEL